jgi:hypothetical protein
MKTSGARVHCAFAAAREEPFVPGGQAMAQRRVHVRLRSPAWPACRRCRIEACPSATLPPMRLVPPSRQQLRSRSDALGAGSMPACGAMRQRISQGGRHAFPPHGSHRPRSGGEYTLQLAGHVRQTRTSAPAQMRDTLMSRREHVEQRIRMGRTSPLGALPVRIASRRRARHVTRYRCYQFCNRMPIALSITS